MGKRSRVAVFAFGTRGDVLPAAVVAAALARADPSCDITFITHEAHRNMEIHLAGSGVARFVAVAAPPVVPGRTWEDDEKVARDSQIREECVAAMDAVMMGEAACGGGGVIINLFALEGWHLAELYRVPCAVLAPYVVPYSAPSAFERRFRVAHPLLYRRLKEAAPGEVGWDEVMHWMWPLFTDRWASWRTHRLHLSACPLTDPVTDLPLLHQWPLASPLLYGFSPQVVECPSYWPRSVTVCGFWFAPLEWEFRHTTSELTVPQATTTKPSDPKSPEKALLNPISNHLMRHTSFSTSESPSLQPKHGLSNLEDSEIRVYISGAAMKATTGEGYLTNPEVLNVPLETLQPEQNSQLSNFKRKSYTPPAKLCHFLSNLRDSPPIFVGMSSVGSMGFLEKPGSILQLLNAVLQATNRSAILLTSGYPPLDLAVCEQCDESLCLDSEQQKKKRGDESLGSDSEQKKRGVLLAEGLCCFKGRLFCYAGSVPYAWLLPQCSVAVHHGGSGTTAACLRAGVAQVVCPFVLDQFYWAERMAWLGVAPQQQQALLARHLMPGSEGSEEGFVDAVKVVTGVVRDALSGAVQACARAWSKKIAGEDGTAVAVGVLRGAMLCG